RFCRMIYHIVALCRVTRRQLKLSFDPQDYKSASKTYGGLTKMARKALTKRQDDRNDEVINRMPFFQKYSMSIKRDLARCLEYDKVEAERVVIRQDHPGFKMYFVSSGKLEIAADVTELRDYPANKSIVGDIPGVSDYVYFITNGDCTVVRKLEMIRQKSPHLESTLHLPEDACGPSFFKKNYGHHWRKQTADVRFVTMFNLHAGDYFAVGENLTNTFIISKGKVQCLVINSVQFEIQAKMEDLQEWAAVRNPMLPSNQFLYAELMANKSWYNYKQEVVEEIIKKRKIPVTTKPEDVPLSIRVEPRVLKK
ncbi:uncharacterized protein LOC126830368, partial [Patella vulgata]|uniref:uncharacterized protein LOC126830368 n=1 Tax=Patella vulgata TaxID=6465 RepID=UPI0024A9CF72